MISLDQPKKSRFLVISVIFIILILSVFVVYKFKLFESAVTNPISTVTNSSLILSRQTSVELIQNISSGVYSQNEFILTYTGNVSLVSNLYSSSEPVKFAIIKDGNTFRINYSIDSSTGFLFNNASGFVSCSLNSLTYDCNYIPLSVQPQVSFGILIYLFSINPSVSSILSHSPYNFSNLINANNYLLLDKIGTKSIDGFNCSLDNVYESNDLIGNICASDLIGLPLSIDLNFTSSSSSLSFNFISSFINSVPPDENLTYIPPGSEITQE